MAAVRVKVLGPVELWSDGAPVTGPPKQRLFLAVLASRVGRPVPLPELVDALWGDEPPASALDNLRTYISRLRRTLGAGSLTGSATAGYTLQLSTDDIDMHEFLALVSGGQAALEAGDATGARRDLAAALDLWRGTPFSEFTDVRVLAEQSGMLAERHLLALESRIEADLRLGRAADLIAELGALITDHPYRERLRAHLMVALYRAGRQADALAVYRSARAVLDRDLGVEPGVDLRRLEQAILRHDIDLLLPAAPRAEDVPAVVPAQLPPVTSHFVGRSGPEALLDKVTSGGSPLVAIVGPAGVGKTALAVHWGHSRRERFPHGQLFIDLRGFHPGQPVHPADALARLLRLLGVADRLVPAAVEEATALYRSLLSERRALVVLDNAADAAQVRPLLPAGPGCVTLVTSRNRLPGLVAHDGAEQLTLDVLAETDATGLVGRIVADPRVVAEPAAVGELADVCGRLPLALRIAAANLAESPQRTVGGYVADLRTRGPAAALRVVGDEHLGVWATFDLSHAALDAAHQRMFELLGLVPGPSVTDAAAAALAGCPLPDATDALHRLTGAHLLFRPEPDRFALHDLVRDYARQRAGRDPAALERLYTHYLRHVDAAAKLLYPQMIRLPVDGPPVDAFADVDQANTWLEAEMPNLVAACVHAAGDGPSPAAWLIADALRGYCYHRRDLASWSILAETARRAAAEAGDETGQAAAELNLGLWKYAAGDLTAGLDHFRAAQPLARRVGWAGGEASAVSSQAILNNELGDHDAAIGNWHVVHDMHRAAGRVSGQVHALTGMALATGRLGRLHEALGLYERLAQVDASDAARTAALINAVDVHVWLGRPADGRPLAEEALAIGQRIGRVHIHANALLQLSLVERDSGDADTGLRYALEALDLLRDTGDLIALATAHVTAAGAYERLDLPGQAAEHYHTARETAARSGTKFVEIEALAGLALARHRLHDPDASALALKAFAGATRYGYRVLEGRALAVLAGISMESGRSADAAHYAGRALDVQAATGWNQGHADLRRIVEHAFA